MNVIPGLTSDRAEAVLHDIAMARTGQVTAPGGDPAQAMAAAPTAEPASAVSGTRGQRTVGTRG